MLYQPQTLMSQRDNLNSIIDSDSFILKKHDVSTTVGVLKGDAVGFSQNLWLKRFNYKGFFDFLLKRIFCSRARRLYDINLMLYEKGLPVPKPVACIEPSFKQKHCFYLSAFIEHSLNLHHFYKRGGFDETRDIAEELAKTIARWHMAGAVHGDMKWPNILVQQSGNFTNYYIVDLDQARLFDQPNIRGIIKDLSRFYRSGLELGAEKWVEAKFFPAYMDIIKDNIRAGIDLAMVRSSALKKWYKKRQPRY